MIDDLNESSRGLRIVLYDGLYFNFNTGYNPCGLSVNTFWLIIFLHSFFVSQMPFIYLKNSRLAQQLLFILI